MKLLLFDIDGTLMLSGNAGLRAMNRAFSSLYGLDEAFTGLQLAGRTDSSIFRDAVEKHQHPYNPQTLEQFKTEYFKFLPEEMFKPLGDKRMMPGIPELLSALQTRPNVFLGLLTGNWQTSGYIKIGYFGLDRYFSFGAFSDDSEVRPDLLPYAVTRFEQKFTARPTAREIFIIGDTPSDIQCAKPHGVVSVAVAAAHHKEKDLAPFAPDFLLPDLTDLERALQILG
jgi:phosphoglycolate phosphatase